jgi:hypothetical protein
MDAARKKSFALVFGIAAIAAAIALCLFYSGVTSSGNVAGGSGDSSPPGTYTQPAVPAMSVDPTNMTLGATATQSAAATALATSVASPTFKATAAAGCVNNGQCP